MFSNLVHALFLFFSFSSLKSLGNEFEKSETNFEDLCSKRLGVEGDFLCSPPSSNGSQNGQIFIPCPSKVHPMTQDEFLIVEANRGADVLLPCHFCHEHSKKEGNSDYSENSKEDENSVDSQNSVNSKEEEESVKWFRSSRANGAQAQIDENNKFTFEANNLKIGNVEEEDSALYFCASESDIENAGQDSQNNSPKFYYILHVKGEEIEREILSGTGNEFKVFSRNHLDPINKEVKERKETEELRIEIGWGVWGECNSCGRMKKEKVKRRGGQCRIIVPHNYKGVKKKSKTSFDINFPCSSPFLSTYFPGQIELVKKISQIPLFSQIESCTGTCEINLVTEEIGKKKFSTHTILYGGSITFKCPNSGLSSSVVWAFEKKFLGPHFLEKVNKGRKKINGRFELEIKAGLRKDSGQYFCFVDTKLSNIFLLHVIENPKSLLMLLKEVYIYVGSYTALCTILWIFFIIVVLHTGMKILKLRKEARKNNRIANV